MLTIAHVAPAEAEFATAWLAAEIAAGRRPLLAAQLEHRALLRGLGLRLGLEAWALPPAPHWPEAVGLRPLMARIAEAGPGGAEAVILGEPVPFALAFRHGTTVPTWLHRYPAVRLLHRLGIRRFRFVGQDGEHRFELPLLLDDFVGRHAGEPAFVIGNGPSLRQLEMGRLRDRLTFGSNRCFLGYEEWGFAFRYWGISDRLQIEMYREEYLEGVDAAAVKFVPFEYLEYFPAPNLCPLPVVSELFFGEAAPLRFPYFSEEAGEVFNAFTVTITLMQIAALMGCNPIVLLGVDHSYPIATVKRRRPGEEAGETNPTARLSPAELAEQGRLGWDFWEGSAATGATHFTDKYTANKLFVPPRTAWAETAYDYCDAWARARGVTILNATPGSHLESFRRAEFRELAG